MYLPFKSYLGLFFFLLSSTQFPSLSYGQCLSENDNLSNAADTDLSGIQDFNIDLFKRLSPKDPNVNFVFSPYSIWNALVLAYFGSSGATEQQFQQVLRVSDKVSTLRKWKQLEFGYTMRPDTSVSNTFVMTNRAFFDNSVEIRSCMFNVLPEELQQLDFKNNPAGAATTINNLVSETTRGHIKQLVSASVLDQARLVLVNAAFFKGNWESVFKPERTENRIFTPFSGQPINVPTMAQFGPFNYGFDDAAKFDMLELPYVGNQLAMYIFRPYEEGQANFDAVINALTTATIDKALNSMRKSQIHVFIPKFSLESRIDDELSTAIISMGLKDAFDMQRANFQDFSLDPDLFLRRGVHEAFLEINEKGTEAGAATAFIIDKSGGSIRFICDRPFIFMIRDKTTSNLLFMGTFKSPDKTEIPATSHVDQSTQGLTHHQDSVPNQQPPQNDFIHQKQQDQQFIEFNSEPDKGQRDPVITNNFQDFGGITQEKSDGTIQQIGSSLNQQQQHHQQQQQHHQQQQQQEPQQQQQEPQQQEPHQQHHHQQQQQRLPSDVNQEESIDSQQQTARPRRKPEGFVSQFFNDMGKIKTARGKLDERSFESDEDRPRKGTRDFQRFARPAFVGLRRPARGSLD